MQIYRSGVRSLQFANLRWKPVRCKIFRKNKKKLDKSMPGVGGSGNQFSKDI